MVGTVHQNRKEVPEEIKLDKKDELYTSRCLFSASENIMMCSYKAKKAKNVYLLSFMHNVDRVEEKDLKRLPEVILFYNETKGCKCDLQGRRNRRRFSEMLSPSVGRSIM